MNVAMDKVTTIWSNAPTVDTGKLRSTEATLAAAGIVGTVAAVQLLTDWNPLGRCYTFWKQLRSHVSKMILGPCQVATRKLDDWIKMIPFLHFMDGRCRLLLTMCFAFPPVVL
jgi:hypothetical protein